MKREDNARWKCETTILKYHEDISPYRRREKEFYETFKPYEKRVIHGNILLNMGIREMWKLICGFPADVYDNSATRIGIGDGTTEEDAAQTSLQGTNTAFHGMGTDYPSLMNQMMVFRSNFGTDEANFAWEEWVVDNGITSLNRKVESLGTKSGGTWVIAVAIQFE